MSGKKNRLLEIEQLRSENKVATLDDYPESLLTKEGSRQRLQKLQMMDDDELS